jgi:catechol 2,3-dioxygenase-like lactoylglutathione lyase family enzyme
MALTTGANHVALISEDADRLVAFYTQLFEAAARHAAVNGWRVPDGASDGVSRRPGWTRADWCGREVLNSPHYGPVGMPSDRSHLGVNEALSPSELPARVGSAG